MTMQNFFTYNHLTEWKQGQPVKGIYCNVPYTGTINNDTRPTPDGRNVVFGITLNNPIVVFGQTRTRIQVWSNRSDYGQDTIEVRNEQMSL